MGLQFVSLKLTQLKLARYTTVSMSFQNGNRMFIYSPFMRPVHMAVKANNLTFLNLSDHSLKPAGVCVLTYGELLISINMVESKNISISNATVDTWMGRLIPPDRPLYHCSSIGLPRFINNGISLRPLPFTHNSSIPHGSKLRCNTASVRSN